MSAPAALIAHGAEKVNAPRRVFAAHPTAWLFTPTAEIGRPGRVIAPPETAPRDGVP